MSSTSSPTRGVRDVIEVRESALGDEGIGNEVGNGVSPLCKQGEVQAIWGLIVI